MQKRVERCRDTVWHREVAGAVVEKTIAHSHMVDKNQKGYLWNEQSQSQARPHNPWFQHREEKSPIPFGC